MANAAEKPPEQVNGAPNRRDIVLSVRDVSVAFGIKQVLKNLSLDVYRGEILGFVGGSGAGKSVLLRTVLGLNRKQSGTIKLFGVDLDKACLLYTSPSPRDS